MSEPELPPPPAPEPRPRRAPSRAPWSVVAIALSVAVVSLGLALYALLFAGGGQEQGDDLEAVRRSALDAATQRTLTITSYDHRTLDTDFAQVLEVATGQFAEDYRATTAQLRPTFTSTQAVAKGTVVAAGLEAADQVRAVAVVAVDQVITTKGAPARTERNRLRMTLVRRDGTWLVEQVERL